jgi:hypothetical protein
MISQVRQHLLQQQQAVTDHVENDQAVDVANEEVADALQHEKHADVEPTVDLAVEHNNYNTLDDESRVFL